MKIGIVAPPWVPVPPPAYGGTELAIDTTARGLMAAGHDVRLFTTGDSTCPVPKEWALPVSEGMLIGTTTIEVRHVLAAYEAMADVDVIHDHTFLGPLMASELTDIPVVTTNHGPFQADTMDLWTEVSKRGVPIISISRHQASTADPAIPIAKVIHHGIDPNHFPVGSGDGGYLACLGRMASAKGIHTAIEVARKAGLPLKIGAKMRENIERQYFDSEIRPLLGGDIEYLGELHTTEKLDLLCGATALLNPIQWAEPFGLVMIESMACGTPVISTPCGSVPEIVTPGKTGYICETVDEMIEAAHAAVELDRADSRHEVETTFSMQRMTAEHVDFYAEIAAGRAATVDLDQVAETGSPASIAIGN